MMDITKTKHVYAFFLNLIGIGLSVCINTLFHIVRSWATRCRGEPPSSSRALSGQSVGWLSVDGYLLSIVLFTLLIDDVMLIGLHSSHRPIGPSITVPPKGITTKQSPFIRHLPPRSLPDVHVAPSLPDALALARRLKSSEKARRGGPPMAITWIGGRQSRVKERICDITIDRACGD